MSDFSFKNKVINENYRPKINFPINESLKSLIRQCWNGNPTERPTFDEIFKKLSI